jgi:manganese/zinc/iron transport system substrate-binding protein
MFAVPNPSRRRPTGALLAGLAVCLAALAIGCAESASDASDLGDRRIRVATTTNFITDTVRRIGGERVSVTGLMGPGVDPHLYKASAGDVTTLRDADVTFYGGLELEGRMADLFEVMAEERTAVAVAEAIPEDRLLESPAFEGKHDPHVWFDPDLWALAARRIADTLTELDPRHAAGYDRRLKAFLADVEAAERACRTAFRAIPERSRVLVTSHDAFHYFGRAFGFEVQAIQGVSTATEASTADIRRIASLLVARKVKAVFVESSVPRQTIEAVIAAAAEQGHRVTVGGELFSDAAGREGTPEGTYPGMLRHNCDRIAAGLA